MARLFRPYIPLEVRCLVVLRQLVDLWPSQLIARWLEAKPLRALLDLKLAQLAELLGCEVADLRLDHDPPLAARARVPLRGTAPKGHRWFNSFGVAMRYEPDANDPEHLFYRPHGPQFAGSHLIKTNVRGDHGQHPDRVLIKKERKRGKPKRTKVKIRSRGFRKIAKQRRRQLPLPPRRMP